MSPEGLVGLMSDWSWSYGYYHEDSGGKPRGRNVRVVLVLKELVQVTISSVADADNCVRLWQGGLANQTTQDRFPPLTYLAKDFNAARFPAKHFGDLLTEAWPGNLYDQALYAYDAAQAFDAFADGVERLTLAALADVTMGKDDLAEPLTFLFSEFQDRVASLIL